MPSFSPESEIARIRELQFYQILDTPPEQVFDDLARLASLVRDTPVSLISFTDDSRVWIKSKVNFDASELPRDHSIYFNLKPENGLLIIEDTQGDERLINHPLLRSNPHIRFYAAAPLITSSGHLLGTLSVLDFAPRGLTEEQAEGLAALARQAMTLLDSRRRNPFLQIETVKRLNVDGQRTKREDGYDEQHYRALVEHSQGLICTHDLEGRLLSVNPAGARALGYMPEELVGRNLSEILSPTALSRYELYLEQIRRDKFSTGFMYVLSREGEERIWMYCNVLYESDEGTAYVLGHAQDLTEFKRAEASLREAHMELERRIEERTTELSSANRELKAEIAERHLAEEALRKSETRFRLLAENAQDIIYLFRCTEPRGFEYVSPSVTMITGYTPEEYYANPDLGLEIVHPDDRHILKSFLQSDKVNDVALTLRWICKDGKTIWIEQRNRLMTDEKGNAITIEGIARDITENKLTEKKLIQSERYYRTLFEQAHDAIIIFEPESETVLDVNRRACQMYKFSREEFIGLSLKSISLDVGRGSERVRQTLEQGGHFNFETVQFRRDGSQMNLEINASVISYEGRRAILSINRDITERKRAEMFEARQRQFLEMVVTGKPLPELFDYLAALAEEQSPNASCVILLLNINKDGFVLGAAPSLPDEFKRGVDGLKIGPDGGPCSAAVLRKSLVIIKDIENDPACERVKALAAQHNLRASASVPIPGTSGEVLGTITLYYEEKREAHPNDVKLLQVCGQLLSIAIERERSQESLRQSEAQLQQSQKMEAVGRLAGGIAHDFNNLLATVILQCDLLLLKLKEDDPLRKRVEEIRKASERAATLTRQLLAFGRKQFLQPKPLNLNTVVEELSKLLKRTIGEDVELRTDLDPSLDEIKADPGQIEQVILNLAVNATDAMPGGGVF